MPDLTNPLDTAARYARQQPLIGAEGQARLGAARVVVLGLGALGAAGAESLARAGVGTLRLIDRDVVEAPDLQRQSLYAEADVIAALPKAVAAAARLAAINHTVRLEPHVADVTAENVAALLAGATLVLDGTDNFAARYLLNDACVQARRPWVYAGVLGTAGMVLAVQPGRTACLRCLYPEPPPPGSTPTCATAGVLGPAVQVVAGLATAAAVQILLGHDPPPGLLACDVWAGQWERLGDGVPDPACPACGQRVFPFLGAGARARPDAARLCGDAVQVQVPGGPPDLAALADRWRAAGQGPVVANAHLVRLALPGPAGPTTLTLFADGRALVQGTDDVGRARGLLARYVGT